MSKVVFPAFSDSNFSPVEMRQFVSALELRFEALETEDIDITEEGDDFSPIGHTHVESEIVDLQPYITNLSNESIFDLQDVDGTPANNDILVYSTSSNAFESVSQGAAASVSLDDLSDVSIPDPQDGEILTYSSTSGVWEALDAEGGAGITSLVALTDTDLTGQSQYDMLFNATTGDEWQGTGGKLQWNSSQQYMQFANNHAINWLDALGATRQMAVLKETGTALVPIDHQEVTLLTEITTASETYVDVTGAFIDQSTLIEGDDYLLIVMCNGRNDVDSTAETNGIRMVDGSDVLLGGSEQIYESVNGSTSTTGLQYLYMNSFTADTVTGDARLQLQHKMAAGTGSFHGVNGVFMQVINISDIPNTQKSSSLATTAIDGENWITLPASVTLLPGDWLIFSTAQHTAFNGNANPYMGLNDGAVNIGPLCARDIPNSTGRFAEGFVHHVSITETTSYTAIGQTGSAAGDADCIFISLIAIRLNELSEFHVAHTTGDTVPVDGNEFDLETLSFNAATTSNDWMFLGAYQVEPVGIGSMSLSETQVDINGAGDVLAAGSKTNTPRSESSSAKFGFVNIPGAVQTILLEQSVVADLRFTGDLEFPTSSIPNNSILAAFPLSLGAGLTQHFNVGHDLFPTRLHGTRIQTLNGIGHDWLDSNALTREILNFTGGAGLGGSAPARNYNEDLVQSAAAGSQTYVDLADAVVTGDNFTVGDQYLVVWHSIAVNSSSLNAGNASRLTLSGVELPGSERLFDGGGAGTDDGRANTYVTSFVYTMGDLQVQYHDASSGSMLVNKTRLLTINLTTLGADNYTESISNGTTNLDDTGFSDTAATITIGDGVSDYMIFAGGRMDNPSNTQCEATLSLDIDNATTIEKILFEEFDDHPQLTAAGMSVALAPAAGTVYKIVGRTTATQGHTCDIDHAYVMAIKLNAFDEYHTSSIADAADPGSSGDFDYQESSFTSMVATGDWAFWSFMVATMGASTGPTARIQANINAGGYADVCFDSVTRQSRENIADQGRLLFPTTDTQLAVGDDVDFKLVMNHNNANDLVEQVHMVAHSWSVAGALVDTTFLGHDSFPTVIKGTTVSLDAPTDVEGDLTVNAGFDFFSDNLETTSRGIDIRQLLDTDITAGDDIDGALRFLNATNDTVLATIEWLNDSHMEFHNYNNGRRTKFYNQDSGDIQRNMLVMDAARVELRVAGSISNKPSLITTLEGFDLWGDIQNDPATGGDQDTLIQLTDGQGRDNASLGFNTGIDLRLINTTHGGNTDFLGENAGGTLTNLLRLDPDENRVYARQALDTDITGTNLADGGFHIMNQSNTTEVGLFAFPNASDLRIQNFINQGGFRFIMRDTFDTDNAILTLTSVEASLWFNQLGVGPNVKLVTNLTGIELHGNLTNDPATGGNQDVLLDMQNRNGITAASLGFDTGTDLELINLVHGGSIDFRQFDVNGADRLMARIEDEEVWLAFNELGVGADRRLLTKLAGIQIRGSLSNDTGGIGDTLIQYADLTGAFVGSVGYLNTIDFDIVNEVLGGKINLTTELAGGGAELSAHTETALLGGLFANNLLTGAGLERVLTESDVSTGGASIVAQYRFDTSIVEADPGNGDFRMDNATPASVTELFVSSTTDNGNDFNTILSLVSVGDQIYIQQDNDSTKFILFDVTANVDNTGWWSIAGTINLSGTIFDSNAKCHILAVFGGSGAHGDVFKVGTPVNEEFAIWTGDGTLASTPDITSDGTTMQLTPLIVQVTQNFRSRGLQDNATARRLLVFNNVTQWGAADDDEYSFTRVLSTGSLGAAGGAGKTDGGNFLMRGPTHFLFPGDTQFRSGLGIWQAWDESAGIYTMSSGIGDPKTLALTIDASQDAAFEGSISAVLDITAERQMFAEDLTLNSPNPKLFWQENDAAVDEGNWRNIAQAGQFRLQTATDAAPTVAAADVYIIERTGTVVDSFDILATVLTAPAATFAGNVDIGTEALFTERADHVFTPIATRGIVWVRDDAPNVLVYTDDADTDFVLNFAPGTFGDVFKVGTPVDNQIGVWTGDGTIEGDANLTWDGAELNVSGDLQINETVPTVFWNETNAPVDNRLWAMAADVGQFYIQLFNDAKSAAAKVFTIDRTLNVADLFTFFGDVSFTEDVTVVGDLIQTERAAAAAPVAGLGQFWVRSDAPNVAMFTDDIGTDFVLAKTVGIPVDNQIGVWTGDGLIEGDADFLWDNSAGAIDALQITAPTGLAGGHLVDIDSNQAGKTGAVTRIIQNHFSASADALLIQQNSNASGAVIFEATHTATSSASYAARIRTAGVHSGAVLRLHHDNPASTGHGLTIKVDGPGDAINIELGEIVTTAGIQLDTDLVFTEQADHTFTPVATRGIFWVRDDAPNVPMFTDDAGTDFVLNAAGGAEINDLTAAVTWANIPDANVPESAVTQHVAAIDHDALLNFLAAEHVDWAAPGAGTIHTDNYIENVSTALSLGTITPTTVGITSDGGADDVVLIEADTTDAGLLGSDKWDEIVANTAKVTNQTHTGDVTGSVALTIAAGVVDVAMLSDGVDGELITWDAAGVAATVPVGTVGQVLTSGGAGVAPTFQTDKRYIQVSGAGAAQVITGTPITMDLTTSDVTTGTGDFTVAADVVTVVNAGTYRISAQCVVTDTDTAGAARTTVELAVEVNSVPVAGSVSRNYHRETEDSTGVVNFFVTLSANDLIRVQLDRLGLTTNIETVPTLCKLNIELIS